MLHSLAPAVKVDAAITDMYLQERNPDHLEYGVIYDFIEAETCRSKWSGRNEHVRSRKDMNWNEQELQRTGTINQIRKIDSNPARSR